MMSSKQLSSLTVRMTISNFPHLSSPIHFTNIKKLAGSFVARSFGTSLLIIFFE